MYVGIYTCICVSCVNKKRIHVYTYIYYTCMNNSILFVFVGNNTVYR